jgi:hypothetical protein
MIYHFVAGIVVYAVAASIVYIPTFKAGPYYFPIGLACAVLTNAIWLHLVRELESSEGVMLAGFWWDAMTVAMYTLIPILCFGVRLRWTAALGMVLTAAGVILTKL